MVYSLGSNGNYDFENDILAHTQCTVVTFDCTVGGRTLVSGACALGWALLRILLLPLLHGLQGPRHKYIHKCLGNEERVATSPQKYLTLEQAMKDNGHAEVTLLKADIEAAEYDVFSTFKIGSQHLPAQICVEIHYRGIYYVSMNECRLMLPYPLCQAAFISCRGPRCSTTPTSSPILCVLWSLACSNHVCAMLAAMTVLLLPTTLL